jgi:hypothetical protein
VVAGGGGVMFGLNDVAFLGSLQPPLWTPADISTALWLDAADASTITQNTSFVSQWSDKSGNARHAIQATAANQPLYIDAAINGKGVISFDGLNDSLEVVTSLFQAIGAFEIFWVFRRDGATTAYNPILSLNRSGLSDGGAFHYYKDTGNGASYPFFLSSSPWGNYDLSSGNTYTNGSVYAMSFAAGAINGNPWRVERFGTTEGGGTRGSSPDIGYTGLTICRQNQPPRSAMSTVCEVIIILDPSIDTRNRVNGYLHHKWGLASNLPSNHPYKSAAPTP